jgi:hypothetical protein
MFIVSPKLTGLMVAVVGGIIGIGSFMGSGLRKLSRQAQAQVGDWLSARDFALAVVVVYLFMKISGVFVIVHMPIKSSS